MSKASQILPFLRESDGYVSGAAIAAKMGITRTAVWKYLKQLEEMGYIFETLKGSGSRLKETPDRLYPWEIERRLNTAIIGKGDRVPGQVDSTNSLAFSLALAGCFRRHVRGRRVAKRRQRKAAETMVLPLW